MVYAPEPKPVPALELRNAIKMLHPTLGVVITRNLIEEIENLGIHLSDENENYFVHEIREALDIIFGVQAAEIVMKAIIKSLRAKKKSSYPIARN
jgi:hypothetical protein